MKRFLFHIILFLSPVLLVSVLLFVIPLNREFAYHFIKGECNDQGSWIYYRIFKNEKSVDIVLSGASHIANGIMDGLFEQKIDSLTNRNLKVANIGFCRGGRDIQYVMLKDLFEYKNPGLLVLEVGEDESKRSHPVFPYLAGTSDLFGSFVLLNQHFFSNLKKGLAARFEYFRLKIFKRITSENIKYGDFGYIPSNGIVTKQELDENKSRWEKRLKRHNPKFFRSLQLNYSLHYLKKILALAKNHNCRVVFLYFPETGSGMHSPFLKDYYESLGHLYIIPEEIINNRQNWKDPGHFNDFGAEKTVDWFSKQLVNGNCFEKLH